MKLILIHGAPATGKLTVARALAAHTGTPLVDNHAAIDIARMVFGFAAPGFWDLVHDLRVTTLRAAARANVPWLITTAAYSHPGDEALLRDYDRAIERPGGLIDPVFLHCAPETRMARVSSPERARRGKISTPDGLSKYLDQNNFAPIPRDNCLRLSTEQAEPEATAVTIARHFEMPVVAVKTGNDP
ncbi:AAA family ATPase [uncultured Tateyamaria sp.]|uniref:AAA family ATPase n=1 Tax=uncultured Tateyamaria sp. TaxID=455651 RepID=UPI002617978E|nr:AAA family ATPase [uncultured Tateyamaria sp.]